MLAFIFTATIGFFVSLYTFIMEQKVKQNPQYKPFCDITDKISCVKAAQSPYSHTLYISNSIIGMLFYPFITGLAAAQANILLCITVFLACIVSVRFAYILFFKIKTLCVLCVTIYIVNFVLLVLSIQLLR